MVLLIGSSIASTKDRRKVRAEIKPIKFPTGFFFPAADKREPTHKTVLPSRLFFFRRNAPLTVSTKTGRATETATKNERETKGEEGRRDRRKKQAKVVAKRTSVRVTGGYKRQQQRIPHGERPWTYTKTITTEESSSSSFSSSPLTTTTTTTTSTINTSTINSIAERGTTDCA